MDSQLVHRLSIHPYLFLWVVHQSILMILLWTSKAKSLSAPDECLPQEPQQITRLPIYVVFLPALGSLKPKASGDGSEHVYFIVSKRCNYSYKCENDWRKSCCMAEIKEFAKDTSAKHTTCYQILKYTIVLTSVINNYHIKTIALHHSRNVQMQQMIVFNV